MGIIFSIPAMLAILILGIWGFVLAADPTAVLIATNATGATTHCDANATVSMGTWLIVSGATYIGGITFGTILIGVTSGVIAVPVVVACVFCAFALAWNVIGWYSLFHDSALCFGLTIGKIITATLVFQLYFITPLYWIFVTFLC
jgi:hypothetical protein